MRYEILGALRVKRDGAVHIPESTKAEVLLGTLLVRAEQVVPTSRLIVELWGDKLPRHDRTGLHMHVSKLRRFLATAAGSRDVLVTQSPGYALRLAGATVDADEFQCLLATGRSELEKGFLESAHAHLESALMLWRGALLGAISAGPIVSGASIGLEELRLDCAELVADTKMRLGKIVEAVDLLYYLTTEFPHREAFHRLLMLALYKSGRRTEALQAYQRARVALVTEFGLEPGRELRRLQRAILMEEQVPLPRRAG